MTAHRSLIILSLVFLNTCGPKQIPPESPLDSAANHYQRGLASLAAGDARTAQAEFERARVLDPDYPGAYAGDALVAMVRGDFWRARKEIEKSLHKDSDFIDAHIAKGRVVTEEGWVRRYPVKEWLQEALASYRKARQKAPDNPAIYYHQGHTYLRALDLEAARESFTRVLELNRGPLVAPAMAEVEKIQMIERGSPGSQMGVKIGLVPQLTRAELAVLVLEELKLPDLMRRRPSSIREPAFRAPQEAGEATPVPTDLAGSWARTWIEDVLGLGIPGLEAFPDGTFRPDQPVTRANYALANQGVLILLTGDGSLSTRYVGEASRFPDVRGDFYAYNAIALNAERGIMSADKVSGRFRPEAPVSGAEALLIIRELQNAFRMEF